MILSRRYARPESETPGGMAAGFNWQKFDAWRKHPLLTNTMRHSVPGIGIGFVAFAAYAAYDQTVGRSSRSSETKH